MSNNSLENDIITCLLNKFTSTNIEIRQIAESKLAQYELDSLTYISQLIFLIANNNSLTTQTKVLITLNLNQSIKSILQDNKLSSESINEMIQKLVNMFIHFSHEDKILINLSTSLIQLFKATESPISIMTDIANYILEGIKMNKYEYDLNTFPGIIILFQSIIETYLSLQSQNKAIEGVVTLLGTIIITISNMLNRVCNSYEKSIDNTEMIITNANIIKSLYIFLNNFIIKKLHIQANGNENSKNINMIQFYMLFIPFGMKILSLPLNNNHSLLTLPISWSEEKDELFDTTINYTKAKILQFIQLSITVLPESVKDEQIISVYMGLTKLIVSSINYIVNNKLSSLYALNSTYRDYKYSLILIEMLKILQFIYDIEPFKEFISIDINMIMKNCILPLIIMPTKEIMMVNECPNDYFNYQINLISSIKENSIRSNALFLLKKLDGRKGMKIGEYIIQLLFYLFDETNYNTLEEKLMKYPLLSCNDSLIYSQSISVEQKVEMCLLLLIYFSQTYIKNQQMKSFIKQFIEMNVVSFISSNKDLLFPYIKHKLIMFLSEYCIEVYFTSENNLSFAMNYIWQNMLKVKKEDKISYKIAQESILKMIKKPNHIEYKQIIYKKIPDLIETIDNKSEILLNILYELIKTNNDLSEYYPIIFNKLAESLQENLSSYYNKSSIKKTSKSNYHNPVMINIIFRIFNIILFHKEFVLGNLNVIISHCMIIFSYIIDSIHKNFDEDIIELMITVINHYKEIPRQFYDYFPVLFKLIDKEKGLTSDTYQLLNLYIVYGKKIIENEENLLALMKIHRKSLPKNNYNKSPILGSMIMEVLLCHINSLPETIVNDIMQLTFIQTNALYSEYTPNINNITKGNDIFIFVSFLGLIYCSMINYPLKLIKLLKQENSRQLSMIIKWTDLLLLSNINSLYQNKLILLGICSIVSKYSFDIQVNSFFLSTALNLLIKQKKEEEELRKNKENHLIEKENLQNEEDEDDNDNDSKDKSSNQIQDAENQWSDYITNKQFEDNTLNTMKDVDEFKVFKQLIMTIKETNCILYNEWIGKYTNIEQQNVINDILFTTRVQLIDSNNQTIPRRIVTVKK